MAWLEQNAGWLSRAAERWAPRSAEPLRLRVWLAGPVAWDDYDGVTIEGALQTAVVLRECGGRTPDEVYAGIDVPSPPRITVPIAEELRAGERIACASWGLPAEGAACIVRRRRKRTRVDLMPELGGLRTSGGPHKNLDIPTAAMSTPYLTFFVRGDRGRLTELLRDVGAIGRCRAGGMGAVIGTEVGADHEDRSVVWRTRPQRSVPVESEVEAAMTFEVGSYELREATTRAPYWRQDSRALCAVPVWRWWDESWAA